MVFESKDKKLKKYFCNSAPWDVSLVNLDCYVSGLVSDWWQLGQNIRIWLLLLYSFKRIDSFQTYVLLVCMLSLVCLGCIVVWWWGESLCCVVRCPSGYEGQEKAVASVEEEEGRGLGCPLQLQQ